MQKVFLLQLWSICPSFPSVFLFLFAVVLYFVFFQSSIFSENNFIYLWLCWVFIALVDFLQLWQAGAILRCGARASHYSGFSCCRARALGTQASMGAVFRLCTCGSWALECRMSSCSAQTTLLCSMQDPPGPGIEPRSLALAGRFISTMPSGKCLFFVFKYLFSCYQLQYARCFNCSIIFFSSKFRLLVAAYGIQFPDQGSNLGPPGIGSVESQPLDHLGSPLLNFLNEIALLFSVSASLLFVRCVPES